MNKKDKDVQIMANTFVTVSKIVDVAVFMVNPVFGIASYFLTTKPLSNMLNINEGKSS